MSSKNNKAKDTLKELVETISPVLVVNNSSLKPYVELFQYYPENIYQKPLGTLIGFFEIKEYSDDSAYIVNFLTSTLKKEYYINPKRPVTESLDAALYKVNLALSEIAKHGNVEWLGKLNAAICVIEKNSVHFSVSGNANIFLYRNNTLNNISEGLASDSLDPHPIKTFVNVSSGRLEKNDRILITTDDIFHILTQNDLKKNFERFKDEKFVQFIKTALSNQLEMIASIIIEIKEKKEETNIKKSETKIKTQRTFNAFSKKTFEKEPDNKIINSLENHDTNKEDLNTNDYTDKKTGHIYIQGENKDYVEHSRAQIFIALAKENLTNIIFQTKNALKIKLIFYKKQLRKNITLATKNIVGKKNAYLQKRKDEKKKELEEKIVEKNIILEMENEKKNEEENSIEEKNAIIDKEIILAQERIIKKSQTKIINLKNILTKNTPEDEEEIATQDNEDEEKIYDNFSNINKEIEKENYQPLSQKLNTILSFFIEKINLLKSKNFSFIFPHFIKIRNLFSSFKSKERLILITILIAIFILPIFIVKKINKNQKPAITSLENITETTIQKLNGEKNIKPIENKKILSNKNNVIKTILFDNKIFAITDNNIFQIENGNEKEYALSQDFGSIISATFMSDLSLIFISTDKNKLISFSVINYKFSENIIPLEDISSIKFLGTYMTYLYALDNEKNQIYRFPRISGGFGEKINWYKDNNSLQNVSSMTLDENIYIIVDNKIKKLFKGKEDSYKNEATKVSATLNDLFTTSDLQDLYALDNKNMRIIKYSKNSGEILNQYQNDILEKTHSISIDEKNNIAYLATSEGLFSLLLE